MFAAEPDNALLLSELCERVYRRSRKRIEKKHRISVARAAKGISELDYMAREALGHELVFYIPGNLMSYAMARLKTDFLDYRNNDPRKLHHRKLTEANLRAELAEGGHHHHHIVEGGAWWEHIEWARMEARGEIEEAKKRRAEWNRQHGY